jgi:NDP-sugar pyrophosphorylase family protein
MNGGIYFFKKEIFKYIPKKISSLENEILPKLIIKKKLWDVFLIIFLLIWDLKIF